MEYKEYKLEELVKIKYGRDQKRVVSPNGTIPIYGTGGFMGYATKALYTKPSVLIGRKGTIDKIRFMQSPFWTVDTLFYTEINENIILPKYFYYLLCLEDLSRYNEGTTIPSLRTETLNRIPLKIPSLEIQGKVLSALNPIDDKIEHNIAINKNLEEQAQAVFDAWFVNYIPWQSKRPVGWESGVLGDYVTIKRGGSPRPIHEYLTDHGLSWLKISDATSIRSPYILDIKECIKESGLRKTVFLNAGALVLSNSATPGIPKILDVDCCIHDGWLYFPQSHFSNVFLYLFFKHIRKNLVQRGNGSVFTNLKTELLKDYPIFIPNQQTLIRFDEFVTPMFQQMKQIVREIRALSELRGALLPRLMSGELDVSNIEL